MKEYRTRAARLSLGGGYVLEGWFPSIIVPTVDSHFALFKLLELVLGQLGGRGGDVLCGLLRKRARAEAGALTRKSTYWDHF